MKNIYTALVITALSALLLSSCVTPMGMTASTTPVGGKKVEVLGKGEGSDSTWSVLGLWQVGRTDVDQAIREAVATHKGDALINVTWQERTYWCVLFSITTLEVKGDVVRFASENERKGRRR